MAASYAQSRWIVRLLLIAVVLVYSGVVANEFAQYLVCVVTSGRKVLLAPF